MIDTTHITLALHGITRALHERMLLLSPAVRKRHWMVAKHAPNPWLSVKEWYVSQPGWDRETADTLVDLVLLSEAKMNLDTILTRAAQHPAPDLTLATVRRTP